METVFFKGNHKDNLSLLEAIVFVNFKYKRKTQSIIAKIKKEKKQFNDVSIKNNRE